MTHKKIIKAINELKAKKIEVSILTITNTAKDETILEYLAYIGDYVSKTTPQTAYQILKDYTKKRQVFNSFKHNIHSAKSCFPDIFGK